MSQPFTISKAGVAVEITQSGDTIVAQVGCRYRIFQSDADAVAWAVTEIERCHRAQRSRMPAA